MDDMAFIVSRMLENKIAVAENNNQNTMLVTLDVLKEILTLLKEQDDMGKELTDAMELVHKKNARIKELTDLLKEQDAVEPYQHDAVWLCGNCEKEVVGWDDDIDGKENRYPFCRQCGKAVKWK